MKISNLYRVVFLVFLLSISQLGNAATSRLFFDSDSMLKACTDWFRVVTPNAICTIRTAVETNNSYVVNGCEYVFTTETFRGNGLCGACDAPFCVKSSGVEFKAPKISGCPSSYKKNSSGECIKKEKSENWGRLDGVNSCSRGNPINFLTGNKFQHEIDYVVNSPKPLEISRTYNSNNGGWSYSLKSNVYVSRLESPSDQELGAVIGATVVDVDGKSIPFNYSNEEFTPDGHYYGNLSASVDADGELSNFVFIYSNGIKHIFSDKGVLARIEYPDGDYWQLGDNLDDDIIEDNYGNSILIKFSPSGNINRIIPSPESEIRYGYTPGGKHLSAIEYPGNIYKLYKYDLIDQPNLLTRITDRYGKVKAKWEYNDEGLATSSEHYDDGVAVDRFEFDYTHFKDADSPRVTVINPLEKSTTYYYKDVVGHRKLDKVEGHESAGCLAANKFYDYYPDTGLLRTSTDWEGVITHYEYNTRGLPTVVTEGKGTPDQKVTETIWHPLFNLPDLVTESNRVTDYEYDPSSGRLERKTVSDTGTH